MDILGLRKSSSPSKGRSSDRKTLFMNKERQEKIKRLITDKIMKDIKQIKVSEQGTNARHNHSVGKFNFQLSKYDLIFMLATNCSNSLFNKGERLKTIIQSHT